VDLRTREEPSLETLWLINMETMEKVQKIDRSYTAPSSKTFRDEKGNLVKRRRKHSKQIQANKILNQGIYVYN
jgi:hypothetical protein